MKVVFSIKSGVGLIALLYLVGCASLMTPEEAQSLDDIGLCRTNISIFNNAAIDAEVARRQIPDCTGIVRAANAAAVAASGPQIINSSAPECAGIAVAQAGPARFQGLIPAMQVIIENSSGERKWIQADIKYTSQTRNVLVQANNEYWETTDRLQTYEAGTTQFWVKRMEGGNTGQDVNLEMEQIRVIACGV